MPEPVPTPASADRNLLFGILALQMDFITRDALIRAMHAWVLDKARPLGEILQEQGAFTAEDRAALDGLARQHLRRHSDDPRRSLAVVASTPACRDLRGVADGEVQASLDGLAGRGAAAPERTVDYCARPAGGAGQRYRVLRPHARGGLGEVFVALDQEVHREVALKEIHDEHAHDPPSRARFLLEAEITGGLEHPGVVPVYGLGTYEDGRPYYAMRLIRGESLRDAVGRFHAADGPDRDPAERRLALRRLLGAFIAVCKTVGYAHNRGVLHRDLKPANVMVGPYGETLVVDWGLAKPVGRGEAPHGAEETLRPPSAGADGPTEAGTVLGTPSYMSPEQAAGRLDRLGPASDVYSLGATLYHLLTGQAPVEGANPLDLLERVRQGAWRPPRLVKPDVPRALDAVCRKAMAADPADRYPGALALADDLEHWLADEPVSAYREPARERLGRWGRRHKPLVSGAAALLVAAVVSLAVGLALLERANARTRAQYQRAEQNYAEAQAQKEQSEANRTRAEAAEKQARAVNDFLINDLLAEAAPEKNPRARQVTVEEVLDRAYAGQPGLEAAVRLAVGETYHSLGLDDRAEPQQRQAVRLLQAHAGPEHLDTLRAVNGLAQALQALGRLAEAEKLFSTNLEAWRHVLGPEHPDTLNAVANLATVLHARGQLAGAEELFRANLEVQRRVRGPEHPDTMGTVNNLAALLYDAGRSAEAEELFRQNLEVQRRVLGPEHRQTLGTVNNLAQVLLEMGRLREAEELQRQNVAAQRRLLGPEHPEALVAVNNLAMVLWNMGRLAEAEKLFRENLEVQRRTLGPEHPQTLTTMNNRATVLLDMNRLAEAEKHFREVLEVRRRALGPEHPDTLTTANNLAWVLQVSDQLAEAEKLFRANVEASRRVLGPEHPDTLSTVTGLATVLRDAGRLPEAEELLRGALQGGRKRLPAGHPVLTAVILSLGELLTRAGKATEAETLIREGLQRRQKSLPEGHRDIARAQSLLGACLTALGRYAEAEPLLLQACENLPAGQQGPGRARREALARLVQLYEAWKKPEQAARWKREQDKGKGGP
jgi:serine/threonine protein kinase/Flp pilus assembly protein TadD